MTDVDAAVVAHWDELALGYDALVRRHAVFTKLADRLIELLPPAAVDVLDVGAGTGLVAERLLLARPRVRVHLCEPAPAMRALAEMRLGARAASSHALAAEEVDRVPEPVEGALASASLHLARLPAALAAIAARLEAGGVLAFNLWWHAWGPTFSAPDTTPLWRDALADALAAAHLDPALLPAPDPRPAPLEPSELESAARAAGFDVEVLEPDHDVLPATFFLDFAAMDSRLLAEVPQRAELFAEAHRRASGAARVASTRLVLTRRR